MWFRRQQEHAPKPIGEEPENTTQEEADFLVAVDTANDQLVKSGLPLGLRCVESGQKYPCSLKVGDTVQLATNNGHLLPVFVRVDADGNLLWQSLQYMGLHARMNEPRVIDSAPTLQELRSVMQDGFYTATSHGGMDMSWWNPDYIRFIGG